MQYTIKAHPTWYANTLFRSRLEATWAAFFDLVGWSWEYEPIDLPGWTPDFRVEISYRSSSRIVLVEVKPYYYASDFEGHPYIRYVSGEGVPADTSAGFGNNSTVTTVPTIIKGCVGSDTEHLWKHALTATRYDPDGKRSRAYRLKPNRRRAFVRMIFSILNRRGARKHTP